MIIFLLAKLNSRASLNIFYGMFLEFGHFYYFRQAVPDQASRISHALLKTFCSWFWRHKTPCWCDDLVVFKLWAGVIYLSFSTDTAPQWILWKRSKEDWTLRASRDGHSSSSSFSSTLLVFHHLLQVQRAAVLWTFSIWLIWNFE